MMLEGFSPRCSPQVLKYSLQRSRASFGIEDIGAGVRGVGGGVVVSVCLGGLWQPSDKLTIVASWGGFGGAVPSC